MKRMAKLQERATSSVDKQFWDRYAVDEDCSADNISPESTGIPFGCIRLLSHFRENITVAYFRKDFSTLSYYEASPFKFLEGFKPSTEELDFIQEFCKKNMRLLKEYWKDGGNMTTTEIVDMINQPSSKKLLREMAYSAKITGIPFGKIQFSRATASHGDRIKLKRNDFRGDDKKGVAGFRMEGEELETLYDTFHVTKEQKKCLELFYKSNKDLIEGVYRGDPKYLIMNEKQIARYIKKIDPKKLKVLGSVADAEEQAKKKTKGDSK